LGSIERRQARSAARTRARTALAWGLALFVCGQLGVRHLVRSDPRIGEPEFGRKLADLRATIAANPGRPLLLMLGSSRVATGFRPDSLPTKPARSGPPPIAFNFSLVGTGPEITHLILHRLLVEGIRPATVLVEYWPPFWTTRRTYRDYTDRIDVGHLDPAGARLLGGYLLSPVGMYREWLSAQLAPAHANRSALLGRFAPAWSTRPAVSDHRLENIDPSGWWIPPISADPEFNRRLLAQMQKHYAPILAHFQTREVPDRALRATLELCRCEGIRSAVVVLPEGPEFRSWYPPEALAEVDAYLDRLRRDCRVPVIDARSWLPESAFMDSHHLLPDGARSFTSHLGTAVLPSILADRSESLTLTR
jgi:hypothetical protein